VAGDAGPARPGHGCPSRRGGGALEAARARLSDRVSQQELAAVGANRACCITAAPMAKSLVPAVTTGR
jgi:hypothetical protein